MTTLGRPSSISYFKSLKFHLTESGGDIKLSRREQHNIKMRSQLHWLDVVDWVRFRVCVQVFRCLHKMAPEYLSTYCQPVSGISGRRHLRSADRGHLNFPHMKLASYGGCSFAYAGPSNWNSLPAHLRDNSLSLS